MGRRMKAVATIRRYDRRSAIVAHPDKVLALEFDHLAANPMNETRGPYESRPEICRLVRAIRLLASAMQQTTPAEETTRVFAATLLDGTEPNGGSGPWACLASAFDLALFGRAARRVPDVNA